MQLRDLLTRAAERLTAAGVPSPEPDARLLLEHTLNLDRTALLLRGGEEVAPEAEARVWARIERRAARIPLQHLLGEVEWGGVRLKSDARALVPRPETEWLLHLASQELGPLSRPRVLDVGTGTGALALGLKAAFAHAEVTASDLSADALSLARENAALNGLDVTFVQADLLAGLDGPFDLIVSNPPYLPSADRETADPEVRHDPDLALYAGPDGLDLARPLAAEAAARLTPGGTLWLELDPRNAPALAAELRGAGWATEVHADLTGRERFVRAWRAE
ncbi:peptide chain release factor N(5)-glutamine methyltransferase [Deinococcus wulumuqiensis]|uniref:Release factor glutamine methyltransferase n=1 Tax=Deinococcus wulumuqiensis TaxID=980427 RepID=A0A345IJB2_9DEIO|nr:peptide chain release factor N(5)-glutamine methyltransferase [Deinococcus wulumuqiensis]AXG99784.1 peptide chain release factor N(5)-glutamine methyltransferase [Deinococcus wulumuqiensis]